MSGQAMLSDYPAGVVLQSKVSMIACRTPELRVRFSDFDGVDCKRFEAEAVFKARTN